MGIQQIIMKADVSSLLSDFLQKTPGTQYVIPVYQRNYTWQKNKHVKKLLDDLDRLLQKRLQKHFIGTIVYLDTSSDVNTKERAIVDGQQRLTTIFLILYAIKHIALENGDEKLVNMINDYYLENKYTEEKYKFRLKPLVSDDEVYEMICQNKIDKIKYKKSKVYENYNYIKNEIEKRLKVYTMNEILVALDRLNVVYIQLDAQDDAQQIFESINSTGVELNAADLIRNYVLMNKTNKEQEKLYSKYWLPIESGFENSKKLEEFFRFYLAVKLLYLPGKKDVYDEFKLYYNEKIKNDIKVEDYLAEILEYKELYFEIYKDDTNDQSVLDFRRIDSKMPIPLLIELRMWNKKDLISDDTYKKCIKVLNTYMIRRHLFGMDTSSISRMFPTVLKQIKEETETNKYQTVYDLLLQNLVNRNKNNAMKMPTDKDLKEHLKTSNVYTLSSIIKFVLEKIENKDNPLVVDTSKLNLEHIMPQTPDKEGFWMTQINGNDEKYVSYVNRLGNLTLTEVTDNSRMGNKDFNNKKKILEKTKHLKLNSEVLGYEKWTDKSIEKRNKELIKEVLDVFPYIESKNVIKNKNIRFSVGGLNANARMHSESNVELLANSEIRETLPKDRSVKEKRLKMIENGDIEKTDNGKLILRKNVGFTSLSAATNFVYGGTNNGWEYWEDDQGNSVNLFRGK